MIVIPSLRQLKMALMMPHLLLLMLLLLLAPAHAILYRPTFAPRGWNSYDAIGAANESQTLANAGQSPADIAGLKRCFVAAGKP